MEARDTVVNDWDNGQTFGCIMHTLLQLPHKILCHHDVEDLAHLVLHELGHDNNFSLDKAIYLVDNPDFDCLKGIAGYSRQECQFHADNFWDDAAKFNHDMKAASFHNAIKNYLQNNSIKRKEVNLHDPDDLTQLGTTLGLKNPSFLTWRIKHGNHGVLLFEERQPQCARKRDLLNQATALLSLC
jgi:hypothetical protein